MEVHLPHWLSVTLQILAAIVAAATPIANVVEHLPQATFDSFCVRWPRLGWFFKFCYKIGVPLWPAIKAGWNIFAGKIHLVAAVLLAVALTTPATLSCSGAQVHQIDAGTSVGVTPEGGVNWSVGVSVTFAALRAADDGAIAYIPNAGLAADVQARVLAALHVTGDSIGVAQTALLAYQRVPNAANQCQLRTASDAVVSAALQVIQLLRDAGATVPPVYAAAVGGVGAVVDGLTPGCPVWTAPLAQQGGSTSARIAAALR